MIHIEASFNISAPFFSAKTVIYPSKQFEMVHILSVTKNIKFIETMASWRRVYFYHKLTLLPIFGRF